MKYTLEEKEAKLIKFLQQIEAPALAFSGGVDSALLLSEPRCRPPDGQSSSFRLMH